MLHSASWCCQARVPSNIARRRTDSVRARDGKMYVPSDSFGGLSPEKKASQALETLLTFTAAKIVLAQLEGSGRGALAAYNQEGYAVLSRQLQEVSLKDPHAWLDDLVRKDKGIALRLMEVRAAYATTDFEWDQLQRLSVKSIKDSNLALMRKAATASLTATTEPATATAEAGSEAEVPRAAGDAAPAAAKIDEGAAQQAGGAAAVQAAEEAPQQQQQQQQQQHGTEMGSAADQQQQQQDQGQQGQAAAAASPAAAPPAAAPPAAAAAAADSAADGGVPGASSSPPASDGKGAQQQEQQQQQPQQVPPAGQQD